MKRGCIVKVELPHDSPFGDSYYIVTEDMTFKQFEEACNLTGCVPQDNQFFETIYIPLSEIVRYYEVREQ